jgi:hypothetical protein
MSLATKKSKRTATQGEVFRAAVGGFAIAFGLPHDKGNLDSFKVVRLEAEKGDDSTKLANKIIRTLGEKPRRSLLDRGAQIATLFDSYADRDLNVVIVVRNAHLLNSKTIYELKIMREYSNQAFPKTSPGFVLLGNPDQIWARIQEYPGLVMRSSPLPPPELRLVTW